MSKKLLLADDSVTIQKVVGITFANEDVELLTETSGSAALARVRANAPDIVLADVSMSEMSGYDLCAAIKADASISHVPVILLTGTFEPYDEARTRQSGADGHIAKPFEAQALVDLVYATLKPKPADPVVAPVESVEPMVQVDAPLPDLEPMARVTPSLPDFSDQSTVLQPPPNAEPPTPRPAVTGEAVRTLEPALDLQTPSSSGDRVVSTPLPDFSEGETAFQDMQPSVEPQRSAPIFAPEIDPSGQETLLQSVVPSAPPVPELPSIDPMGMETLIADPLPDMDFAGQSTDQPTQFIDPNSPGPLTPVNGPDSEPSLSTDSDIFGAPLVAQEPEPEPGVLAAEEALEAIEAMPSDSAPSPLPAPESFDFNEPEPATSAATQSIVDADTSVPELQLAPIEDDPIETAPLEEELEEELAETDPSPFDPSPLADTQPEADTAGARMPGDAIAAASDLIKPEDVRAALEKVAWDAFGSLSEQVVRDVVAKLEAVAWEVVPVLAERLISEEIQRLKNGKTGNTDS